MLLAHGRSLILTGLIVMSPGYAQAFVGKTFDPTLAFPRKGGYKCTPASGENVPVVGDAQGKELLSRLLPHLQTEYQSPEDFKLERTVRGRDSFHLVYNLQQDGIPIDDQELTLSVDSECNLFRYQSFIAKTKFEKVAEGNGSRIDSEQAALQLLKGHIEKKGTKVYQTLNYLEERFFDLKYKLRLDAENATARKIYLVGKNNELVLNYLVNLPIGYPQGSVEFLIDSRPQEVVEVELGKSNANFRRANHHSYAMSEDRIPFELLRRQELKFDDYGDDPKKVLGDTYTTNFWSKASEKLTTLTLDYNVAYPIYTNFAQFFNSKPFDWPWFEGNDFGKFLSDKPEWTHFQTKAILNNLATIDKSINYIDSLGYTGFGEYKVGLVLAKNSRSEQDDKTNLYMHIFDMVSLGSRCDNDLFDRSVAYHEVGHAIHERLRVKSSPVVDKIPAAISEAIADYWAGVWLSRDPKWNGEISAYGAWACPEIAHDVRDLIPVKYDYFEGFEQGITRKHSDVMGPRGKVPTEELLAAPLLAARNKMFYNNDLNNNGDLQTRYRGVDTAPGAALADQIVLEALAGLDNRQDYRHVAVAIVSSAMRLMPDDNTAANIYLTEFYNANLLPRAIDPGSQVAFVEPDTGVATVRIKNKWRDYDTKVTAKFASSQGDPVATTIEGGKQVTEQLQFNKPGQCFTTIDANLRLARIVEDSEFTAEDRDFAFKLVSGQEVRSIKAKPVGEPSTGLWNVDFDSEFVANDNTLSVVAIESPIKVTRARMFLSSDTSQSIDLTLLAHPERSLSYWYQLPKTVSLSKGKWIVELQGNKATEVVFKQAECVAPFTIVGKPEANEETTLSWQAMRGLIALPDISWAIKDMPESDFVGTTYNTTLPNFAKDTSLTVTARMTRQGITRTESKSVLVKADNDPAKFKLVVAGEVDEEQTITASISELSDPDSTKHTYLWTVDGQTLSNNTATINWKTPQVKEDRKVVIKATVIDAEDQSSQSSQNASFVIKQVNQPPVVSLGTHSVRQGGTLSIVPSISDSDTEVSKLTKKWLVHTDSGVKEFTGASLSFPVDKDYPGKSIKVTLTVSDGDKSTTASSVVPVIEVNRRPSIEIVGKTTAAAEELVIVKAQLTDENPDAVKLKWVVQGNNVGWKPVGVKGDAIEVGIGRQSEPGQALIKLVAIDGDFKVEKTHTINWPGYSTSKPVLKIKAPKTFDYTTQQFFDISFEASDPDSWPKPVKVTWQQLDGKDLNVKPQNEKTITVMPQEKYAGQTVRFKFVATDGATTTEQIVSVKLNAIPGPIIKISEFTDVVKEGEKIIVDASQTKNSLEGKPVFYNWKVIGMADTDAIDAFRDSKLVFTAPEVANDTELKIELTASYYKYASKKILTVKVKDTGSVQKPESKQMKIKLEKKAGAQFEIDAAQLTDLDQARKYKYQWRQTKGDSVTWIEQNGRVAKIALTDETSTPKLGFTLDLTTEGVGVRSYTTEVAVSRIETTVVPPDTGDTTGGADNGDSTGDKLPKPKPANTGGGGGGSANWWLLLALAMVWGVRTSRRKKLPLI